MKKHIHSFRLAFEGIWYAVSTQLNFKVHFFFLLLAIFLGVILNISFLEWLIILLTVVLMFSAEMINTSIESMTNLITTEHRKQAKISKDVSAGMVLTSAIGSVIVGLAIFAPKLVNLFK